MLWHHTVHEKTLAETLAYYQLSFVPVYRRVKISHAIGAALREHGITSYCIYETYGLYDILIRAWVPKSVGPTAFAESLKQHLENLGCTRVLPFIVSRHELHWGWLEGRGPSLHPQPQDVSMLTRAQMVKAESPGTSQHAEMCAKFLAKPFTGDNAGGINHDGIKFFVVIPPPMMGVAPAAEHEEEIIKQLVDMVTTAPGIREPSMYVGTGFAWILVKAKIDSSAYASLDDFVQRVNDLGVKGFYIRTYTYLTIGSQKPYSVEVETAQQPRGLGDRDEAGDLTGDEALAFLMKCLAEGRESDTMEVKASIKLDVQRYLVDPNHPKSEKEVLVTEGLLKTVAAFLNTSGGRLLIGALEVPYLNKLRLDDRIKQELEAFPRIGDWVVSGIAWEMELFRSVDRMQLAISDLVSDRISADAGALIGIRSIRTDKTHCLVITVPRATGWYYVDGKTFYVRRAGSTTELNGTDRDRYQGNERKS